MKTFTKGIAALTLVAFWAVLAFFVPINVLEYFGVSRYDKVALLILWQIILAVPLLLLFWRKRNG